MEKQNIIDGIRLIVIIGIFIFMVIGSYRNIINQNKVISTNTYIDKDNEIVNSNLEKEEVTNIEEKISDTDYKEYKEISKDDINEYDSITINNIQNENTYTDLINEVYEITNNYRSLVEVSSLTLDSSLVEAANIRAKELSDSFSHTRPNGSSCFTVLSELGISYGTAGENIAAGYSSSQSVMEGWRSSSGHYQNIISSKFKKIGIGVNIINNQYYWVQIFSN
jgi:SCP-like extracellular